MTTHTIVMNPGRVAQRTTLISNWTNTDDGFEEDRTRQIALRVLWGYRRQLVQDSGFTFLVPNCSKRFGLRHLQSASQHMRRMKMR
eukprot:6474246-Amphidinium_carterae.1